RDRNVTGVQTCALPISQLSDLNGDGLLDLVLVGYQKAGIEIYYGDGAGNWTLQKTLPQSKPDSTMPGRDLLVADLNHDGHADIEIGRASCRERRERPSA